MKLSFIKKILLLSNFIFFISILVLTNKTFSQNVGIGTNTPNSSAQLEIKSNTKGILIPRTSSISRNGILNPAKALMLYDSVTSSFWFYNGSDWIETGRIDPALVNTFFGFQSGSNINLGVANTGIGHQALSANTDGGLNTALGYFSLLQNTTGNSNTAVGNNSLRSNTSGIGNTAIGSNSLSHNTTGNNNTTVGNGSLDNNTTGNNNSVLGVESMVNNTTGTHNTAAGYRALYNNFTGYGNVAMGSTALSGNTSGYCNVAIGPGSLASNNGGSNNVGIGDSALFYVTSGIFNIAVGSKSLYNNGTGLYNVAIGAHTLFNNNASDNIAIGSSSLSSNTSGTGNIAMGIQALVGNATGINNIGIGGAAGSFVRTSNNTMIGVGSNVNSQSVANSTALGYHANVGCSNCMALGGTFANGDQTRVGINNPTPVTDLHIIQQSTNNADISRGIRLQSPNGNHWRTFLDPGNNYVFQYNNSVFAYIEPVGGAYINSSDMRLKKDIAPLTDVMSNIMQLQAKTYHYKSSDGDRRSYGFLAQEVEKLFPDFVYSSENGMKGIAYSNFSVIAVKAIQEQQQLIEILMKKNEELEKRITRLENR